VRVVQLEQGSEAWLDFRRNRRNASETSVVLGISPYQKPMQLARIKRGEAKQYTNAAMSRGSAYEAEARAWYECETGIFGEPAVVELEPYAASLDFWNQEKRIVVDFKVPSSESSDLWQMALKGDCPAYYACQLQHQAALVDADILQLAVYMPELKDGRIITIERSAKAWEEIRQAWDSFWTEYMLPESLQDDERTDQDWLDSVERYRAAKTAYDAANSLLESIKEELIELANKQSAKGCGLTLTKTEKPGSVKWAEVAKALNPPADLVAKYTGKASTSFAIRINGE